MAIDTRSANRSPCDLLLLFSYVLLVISSCYFLMICLRSLLAICSRFSWDLLSIPSRSPFDPLAIPCDPFAISFRSPCNRIVISLPSLHLAIPYDLADWPNWKNVTKKQRNWFFSQKLRSIPSKVLHVPPNYTRRAPYLFGCFDRWTANRFSVQFGREGDSASLGIVRNRKESQGIATLRLTPRF